MTDYQKSLTKFLLAVFQIALAGLIVGPAVNAMMNKWFYIVGLMVCVMTMAWALAIAWKKQEDIMQYTTLLNYSILGIFLVIMGITVAILPTILNKIHHKN